MFTLLMILLRTLIDYEGRGSIEVSGRLGGTVTKLVASLMLAGAWESGDPGRMLKIQSHFCHIQPNTH